MTSRRLGRCAASLLVLIGLVGWPGSATTYADSPAKAYFAGGCFWCMEEVFEQVAGVTAVTSGYMGGSVAAPTYEEVSAGRTGHAESIEVTYDPATVPYQRLLDVFWRNVDPVTPNAQFCDHGPQYRAAIFYRSEDEKRQAEESKHLLEQAKRFSQPIVTQIVQASTFYPAEEYHQDFYKKNPIRYKYYKFTCGRAQRLAALWGKP